MDALNKIVLFHPKHAEITGNNRVPLELIAIGTPLKFAGYTVKIIDSMVDENYPQLVLDDVKDAIFLGISSMTGYQISDAVKVAKLVRKKYPKLPIVWGGWHASILPEETIKSRYVDIIVQGIGERTVVELANSLKGNHSLKDINGLYYKKNKQIFVNRPREIEDINNFPPMDYSIVDIEKYVTTNNSNERILNYITARGCPFRCRFCADVKVHHRKWLPLKAERILTEIEHLIKKYSIDVIVIEDTNFFMSEERVKIFCEGIIRKGIKVKFRNVNGRAEQLVRFNPGSWELLQKTHFNTILIGAESGNQDALDFIIKDAKVDDLFKFAKISAQHNIEGVFSFMIGLPMDKGKDKKATIDTFKAIKKIKNIWNKHRFLLFLYTPYPGTPLFETAIKLGLKKPKNLIGWSKFSLYSHVSPWLNEKEVDLRERFINFYFPLVYPPEELQKKIRKTKTMIFFSFLHGIAKIRFALDFYSFPIEWMIYKRFKQTWKITKSN